MTNQFSSSDYSRPWNPDLADLLAARSMFKKRSTREGLHPHGETEPGRGSVEENSWLLTYLDVMTLLLVMMVVMLALTPPALRKPEQGLASTPAKSTVAAQEPAPVSASINPKINIVPPLRHASSFRHLPIDQVGAQVEVIEVNNTMRFRIRNELLFASGEASLTAEGLTLLDTLLPTFTMATEHNIVVQGHADNTPINTLRYPSNWELAAGRASSVVRHLQSRGIQSTRLSATGYADTRPIASNSTVEGQRANRRVELILELPRQGD